MNLKGGLNGLGVKPKDLFGEKESGALPPAPPRNFLNIKEKALKKKEEEFFNVLEIVRGSAPNPGKGYSPFANPGG